MADDKIVDFAAKRAASIVGDIKKNSVDEPVSETGKDSRVINTIQDGKVVQTEADKVDPQATIEVKNDELNRLIDVFEQDRTPENLAELLKELDKSRLLVPGMLNDKKVPIPLTLTTPDGIVMQPCFTDKSKIPENPKSEVVMNLPFKILLQMIVTQGKNVQSLAINPFTKTVVLKRDLLDRMFKEMTDITEAAIRQLEAIQSMPGEKQIITNPDGTKAAQIRMSESQYYIFERNNFEINVLPKMFFGDGDDVIQNLVEKKEGYIDQIFEASYQNQRMYPYLPDEFKVVAMGVSEDVEVVVITMPKQDISVGTAYTLYLVWNKAEKKGKYFAIIQGKTGKDREVVELDKPGHPVHHGPAPEEGTEFSWIMDRALK